MTKNELLYKLEQARNMYRSAKERDDIKTMAMVEKAALNIKFRLKYCICLTCKTAEKDSNLWPFCSKECNDLYEENRKRTLIEPMQMRQTDEEFQKRMERVPEILALLRERMKSKIVIPNLPFKHA